MALSPARGSRRAALRLAWRSWLVGLTTALASGGCAELTARPPAQRDAHPHRAGLLHVRWQADIHPAKLFAPHGEECASGTLAGEHSFVIGSRAAEIVGLDPDTGHLLWGTKVSGGVDGQARYDRGSGLVLVGADDGALYAVDPTSGKIAWTHVMKGSVDQPPALGADTTYVASTADRLVALETKTGKVRWQYERDTPDGFTLHGYAAPRLAENRVLMGFADGFLASLDATTGEVAWAKSLASASEQFVDVDTTPMIVGDAVFAASYSGGFYALDLRDGGTHWRLPIEGASSAALVGDAIFFVTPREGLHAIGLDGHVRWRQGLSDAGNLATPLAWNNLLIISASRAGVLFIDREDGHLLEVFNPGRGVCGAPVLDPVRRRLYVLANGGTVYGLDVN